MSLTERPPLPPLELATRVFRLDSWTDPYKAYDVIGRETRDALSSLLPSEWTWENRRVMDFGAGAGRTLRHFWAEAEVAEFWGVEMDADSVAWMQEHLCPPMHAWRSAAGPPMGLEAGSFDLIYAVSVFTHLTDTSIPWLLELHRLLKPNGLLIATFTGRWNSDFLAGEPWDETRIGMNHLHHNRSWDWGGPTALMSEWWVREHWGRAFDIVDITPQVHNQSWTLMRKRDVDLTTDDVERPSHDAREHRALRHNLRQVRRELDQALVEHRAALSELERRHQDEVERVRRHYEDSASWQLTGPLRLAAQLGRRMSNRRR